MSKLSLVEDLCTFFGVKDQGLDALADLIEKGIKPEFGGKLRPAKLIIALVGVDDDAKIRNVIREVNLLKQAAGDNIITIVTVTNRASIRALPEPTRNALQVLP